jgi:hypothetical protein
MIDRDELQRLAARGEPVGADEVIARLEARLEGRPVVDAAGFRTGSAMRRTLGPAVLAAAAVLLLIGGVFMLRPTLDDSGPPPPVTMLPPPPEVTGTTIDAAEQARGAMRLAEAYIDALNAYDAAAVRVLLAPDAVVRDPQWEGLEELDLGVEANRVWGLRFEPFECRPNPLHPEPGKVLCTYTLQTALHRIEGARLLQSTFDIHVSDGLIVRAYNMFYLPDMRPAFEPFHDWTLSVDRRAQSRIFYNRPGSLYWTPILTEEALAEAASLLAAYEEWLSEQ